MNPDDLLAQIQELLTQYLSLGPDTPVAPEATQLLQAIQGAGGGAGDQAGMPPMPPDAGGMPPPDMGAGAPPMGPEDPMMMTGDTPVPDMTQGMPGYSGGSFKDASAALAEDMKKKKKTKA